MLGFLRFESLPLIDEAELFKKAGYENSWICNLASVQDSQKATS
jgi:hypothetical protein